jgi:flagellar FliL protein
MKRNMLAIIILALLVINTVLTGIVMLSVMQTNQKTATVISDIAAALELEAGGGAGTSSGFARQASDITAAETANFEITDIQISLAKTDSGQAAILQCSLNISMDTVNSDYATLGSSESLAGATSKIKSIANEVVSQYNYDNISDNQAAIEREILYKVHDYFCSAFIYDISFSSFLPVKM